jgi:hypothetical protein
MARSSLVVTTEDLISDSGSVLWSIVKGEQLEYPVTIEFIQDSTDGYIYEAVVVEANNVVNQTEPPTAIKVNGVQTVLEVRLPNKRGEWLATTAYNTNDFVIYEDKVYEKLFEGAEGVVSNISPDLSDKWQESFLNKIYLRFPSSLGNGWTVPAAVGYSSYGYFELRVSEPDSATFKRTWKPIRGLVELLFSPTDIVPDA